MINKIEIFYTRRDSASEISRDYCFNLDCSADNEAGRFVTTDPLDYVDGMNLYCFVNANVVNMVDPLGLAGYFFDGTGNDKDDDSKMPTHIAEMFYKYSGDNKFYTWGVGTRSDIALGNSSGKGAKERLNSMFERFEKAYQNGDKEIDIFGFSRGAAMAREFTNMISEKYQDAEIRFLGLFDTVAQFGSPDPFNVNSGIRQDIPGNVKYTAHAVARDEVRSLFPLTSIVKDSYDEWNFIFPDLHSPKEYYDFQGDDFTEKTFAGAHSDIGGGYWDGTNRDAANWMINTAISKGVPLDNKSYDFTNTMHKNKYGEEVKLSSLYKDRIGSLFFDKNQFPVIYDNWHDSRWSFAGDKVPFTKDHSIFGRNKRRIFQGNKPYENMTKAATTTKY